MYIISAIVWSRYGGFYGCYGDYTPEDVVDAAAAISRLQHASGYVGSWNGLAVSDAARWNGLAVSDAACWVAAWALAALCCTLVCSVLDGVHMALGWTLGSGNALSDDEVCESNLAQFFCRRPGSAIW